MRQQEEAEEDVADAKVLAIAPWFGGKRTMAPEIVAQLGPHGQYFEPFCGSMAVLFAKDSAQKETVNDLHGDLINLARVLRERAKAEELYERLMRTLFCDALLQDAKAVLSENTDALPAVSSSSVHCFVERAYWYFVASWMGRNGTAGTARIDYQIAVRWTKNGGSPTVRWNNALASIPWWHQRLRNVVILSRDAFEIIDRFEDCTATAIYCDPPYHAESRTGFKGNHGGKNGSGAKYKHEFRHDDALFGDDHKRLADVMRAYKHARIVLSYYDCPRIRELYDGWTFLDKTRRKHLHAQNGKGAAAKTAPEVLIINGPAYETDGDK
jgi:DNA adenine methylase